MKITVDDADMTKELLEVANTDEFRKTLTGEIDKAIIEKLVAASNQVWKETQKARGKGKKKRRT